MLEFPELGAFEGLTFLGFLTSFFPPLSFDMISSFLVLIYNSTIFVFCKHNDYINNSWTSTPSASAILHKRLRLGVRFPRSIKEI